MNIFDLSKLNKYQKGMIISLLIFLISMIGFLFNSRVRISKSYIEIPDIIIEEPIETDPKDVEPNSGISSDTLYTLAILISLSVIAFKIMGIMIDD